MATTDKDTNKNIDKLQDKKDKVMRKKTGLSSTTILIGLMIGAMAVGGFMLTRNGAQAGKQVNTPKHVRRISISGPVDYTEERVDMKKVPHKTEGKWITIKLSDVKKHKLVRFEFRSPKINVKQRNFAGKPVLPVMAMVTPPGELMVGVSYCEPCRSTTFHTERDLSLTCNICGTKWDAESLIAWSGACMPFPPDEIKVEVKDGKILIPKAYLEEWEPREEA